MRDNTRVIIAGGGICGLATALTLHQIGVPCQVFEAVSQPRPLGVGINLQPNAVRELFALGIEAQELDDIGIEAREWALVGLNGNDIYSEPRGTSAGYHWPQYAVHRGELQMLLLKKVQERLGPDAVCFGQQVTGYSQHDREGVTAHFLDRNSGQTRSVPGSILIAAEGIHSPLRQQMHPGQPSINWGGFIMWRGVTWAKAVRSGSSFVGLGSTKRRVVFYPISQPDAQGYSLINWIAEQRYDVDHAWDKSSWFTETPTKSFIELFEDMRYDWLDVPQMIAGCEVAFENPMIDRDPLSTWRDGRVLLMGDAAHPMYPTGSNGASQAIIDARQLGAKFLDHGVGIKALEAFDQDFCEPVNQIVLRNRGDGPFAMLKLVDQRCGGVFDDIEAVLPQAERDALVADYKRAAGFAREALNAAPPIIPTGARVG